MTADSSDTTLSPMDDSARNPGALVSRVFLVGFMGAGKTTVGRVLAAKLGHRFLDLDDVIEEKAARSVREIFAELGEAHFRRLEREALSSCAELNDAVIALGGGAYVSEENRAVLRSIGKTVWLDCPLEVCLSRIAGDSSRPLVRSRSEMEALHRERQSAYEKADLVIRTAGAAPEDIAASILRLLEELNR